MDDPYRTLANAIIVQAAKDYRKALRQLRRNRDTKRPETRKMMSSGFFHSEWFHFLTDADPDYLLDNYLQEGLRL